jgi:hypothetical protein
VPACAEDGYPMVPVRDAGAAGFVWECSNPWHPKVPGPCPACGDTGRPHSFTADATLVARCAACRHQWAPPGAPTAPTPN